MSLGGNDPRRELCDELARLLSGGSGPRLARLLQLTGLLRTPAPVELDPASLPRGSGAGDGDGAAQPISIWRPTQEDGEWIWERPRPSPLGDHYASRRRWSAREPGGPRRVAFFGESVAAGYLYAPWYTPAAALESLLCAASDPPGEPPWEVIDLARTNERLDSMVETFEASLQLEPDAAVFFAGNNWHLLETPELSTYAPQVRWRQRFGLGLRAGGLRGPLELAARQLERRVRAAMARIASSAAEAKVPVVLVLPEVNLADWPARQPVAWLPEDGCARWYELEERAESALLKAGWTEAAKAAEAMIDLDAGTNPSGYRLLSEARRGAGDRDGALEALRAEVDTDRSPTAAYLPSPRATGGSLALLRAAAREHGFATVDLAPVFTEHTQHTVPGRRMFLDYCHLTSEGIRVAMAAVAPAVLATTVDRMAPRWQDLLAQTEPPEFPPEADAVAKLGAAIHTAHRLPGGAAKPELLRYWCAEAIRAWPGLGQTMLDLATARCAPIAEPFTAAQQSTLAAPATLGFQHGWRWESLDGDLLEAMRDALREAGKDETAEQIQALLEAQGATPDRPIELAVPGFHLAEPVERFYPEAMAPASLAPRAMLRCPARRVTFHLPSTAEGPQELTLVARLPPIPGLGSDREGNARLTLNQAPLAELRLLSTWTRHRETIATTQLKPGLNRLTLHWPMPAGDGEQALTAARERLENGEQADLHPVFGEIYSLRISASPRGSRDARHG